jgi:RNA recognition motif-containing protein
MNRNYSGGKRQREALRDRKKKEKQARLDYNRAMRAQGQNPGQGEDPALLEEPEKLPEVKLEDVVISVAQQPRRITTGPVRLFVGGLSWDTTTDDLRAAFVKFGPIEDASVVLDRTTGRSRGFGFVTFEKSADAAEAVKTMNGAELDGRTLKVNQAESR